MVEIDWPDVLLVRDANGRTNWDSSNTGASAGWAVPPIRSFTLMDGHVEIDDARRKLKFLGTVSSQESNAGHAFGLTGKGTLNGKTFLADIRGGLSLLNVDASRPYHFTADIREGATHAILDGRITRLFHLDRFAALASFTGASLRRPL